MTIATLRPFYLWGTNPVRITQETGWAPGPVWEFWGKHEYFAPVGNRTLHGTAPSLVTTLTDIPGFTQ